VNFQQNTLVGPFQFSNVSEFTQQVRPTFIVFKKYYNFRSLFILFKIFTGNKPTAVFVVLIEQDRTSIPSFTKSPYKFEHFGLKFFQLNFGGLKFPENDDEFDFNPENLQRPTIITLVGLGILYTFLQA